MEEVEETLKHMQKLGISTLASQWLENNSRFKTVSPEDVFVKKLNRKKEHLLGFVKPFDAVPKSPGNMNPKAHFYILPDLGILGLYFYYSCQGFIR